MITIKTDKGIKIKALHAPDWNEFHRRFYVPGHRWIKSKNRYSTSYTIHYFKDYIKVEE
jgi:hypothetical protein